MTLTPLERARLIEFAEASAFADMLRAAPPGWGASVERTPLGCLLLAPAADLLLFNRLIGCGLDAPADRAALRECLARVRAIGIRSFGVQLSPAAHPAELASWLEGEGLAVRDRWTKAVRAAGPVATDPAWPRVTRASIDDADAVARITCASFGMPDARAPWIASLVGRPNWRHYLAWDGDGPIAAAALFIDGAVGWLGVAGTLAAARRRGAQRALLSARLIDGAREGCRWFTTETDEQTPSRPNPSFRNMMRAGFEVAYQRENFLAPIR